MLYGSTGLVSEPAELHHELPTLVENPGVLQYGIF